MCGKFNEQTLFFILLVVCSMAGFPQIALAQDDGPTSRVVYFHASDKAPRLDVDIEIDGLVKKAQNFFAVEMERHGFGKKTFQIEADANGNTVVHHVVGKFPYAHYLEDPFVLIPEEISEQIDSPPGGFYIIMVETDEEEGQLPDGVCGYGKDNASIYCWDWEVVAHEVGHVFELRHDFRDDKHIMSYGVKPNQLSKCAAEWLDVYIEFNRDQPPLKPDETNATVELLLLTPALPPNVHHFRIKVTDPDGIHQVQLVTTEYKTSTVNGIQYRGGLAACEQLNGNPNTIVEFVTPQLPLEDDFIQIRVIDMFGHITFDDISVAPPDLSDRLTADVNGDSVVNVEDLMLVAASFGPTSVPDTLPDTDVNDDGKVNGTDIELVLAALEGPSAVPSPAAQWMAMSGRRWIREAKRLKRTDARFQRGIAVLERWLATLLPTETVLLANYPNPFNPETWIPYQLSEPGEVILHIYSGQGALIRTLTLGHQSAGTYQSRTQAAHWDGRNQQGESVASGIYFYTLSAGDFTATRKMLIRK